MSFTGTSPRRLIAGGRRGAALPLVTLLLAVLTTFCLSAVSCLLGALTTGSDSEADARATYVAEVGRAAALAHLTQNPAGPWSNRSLTSVTDDTGAPAGEYSYTITDLTLPGQDQRCAVQVVAYWPTQANALAERRLSFWAENDAGTWNTAVWTSRTGSGDAPNTPKPGLTFVERLDSSQDGCEFRVRNDTGSAINVTHLVAAWGSPTVYYQDINFEIVDGEDFGQVWDYNDHGAARMWNGGVAMFDVVGGVLVPAGSTMEIKIEKFQENRIGPETDDADVEGTIFTIELWAGADRYIFVTVPAEP